MTIADMLRIRQQNQYLLGRKAATPQAVVQTLGAVQAQDYQGAKWGIVQRTQGVTGTDFDAAFAEGKILRTHVLRPTWHFVLPQDIRWMLKLTAPRVWAASQYYWRKAGLTDDILHRTTIVLRQALAGRQLTRLEIASLLESAGIAVSDGRLGQLFMFAELAGTICSGALRGKQHTYALLDERVPAGPALPRSEALTRLALRYFTGHGPATLKDYMWWSGLAATDAQAGLTAASGQLASVQIGPQTYWMPPAALPAPQPALHLLPNYDEYIVAYTDRSPLFDLAHTKYLDSRQNPVVNNTIILDGKIIGTWQPDRTKRSAGIAATLFIPLSAAEAQLLAAAEAQYVARIAKPPVT